LHSKLPVVSIGKRLIDLARSELNSLLERASDLDEDEDRDGAAAPGRHRDVRLADLSDAELEAEIERRRLEREMESRARRARASTQPPPGSGPTGRDGYRPNPAAARPRVPANPIALAYASLEVKPGSDFDTVRRAYRMLMRKYHPDRHTATPEKQKAANELAQKLTDAYKTLERHLRR
jgi:DnaJ-domain-containing protein 1